MTKRKREKCNKGLRHFSLKVCEKVKQKSGILISLNMEYALKK
jgi:hypothetical protein